MSDDPCPHCGGLPRPPLKQWACGSDYFGVDGEPIRVHRTTTCYRFEVMQLRHRLEAAEAEIARLRDAQ